jgi:hypothetical protein
MTMARRRFLTFDDGIDALPRSFGNSQVSQEICAAAAIAPMKKDHADFVRRPVLAE